MDGDGRSFAGMGVDFADYDNDGFPDLVVTTSPIRNTLYFTTIATALLTTSATCRVSGG